MSIKKRISALLAGALLLGCGCSAEKEVLATPPFWVVENQENGATLYLLGSMHVGESGLVYPNYVLDAYSSCDTVAVELDTMDYERSELTAAAQYLLLPDGTTAEELLGDSYRDTVDFLKQRSLYDKSFEDVIPYFWCSSMAMDIAGKCDLYAAYGTEAHFLGMAHSDGKQIAEIESFAEQYAMMAEIPMEIQLMTLENSIGSENYAVQVQSTRELYEDWLYFDVEGLESLDDSSEVPEELQESYAEFLDLMYNDRQSAMAEFALDCLDGGEDVFMLVGAAHFFVGEDIITLLEQNGYTATAIRV